MIASRGPYQNSKPRVHTNFYTSVVDFTKSATSVFPTSANGMELSITRNTGCIEIESPFYQPTRFSSTRYIRPAPVQSEALFIEVFQQANSTLPDEGAFQSDFVATGEDFTLFFFLSVPRYYRWNLPTEETTN